MWRAVVAGARFCVGCRKPVADAPAPAGQRGAGTGTVAERRLVSVLFADLVGFTTLAEHRDPEEVRDLLTRYFDRCRSLIQRYGGTVEKFIGDAVMAVWGRAQVAFLRGDCARAREEAEVALSIADPGELHAVFAEAALTKANALYYTDRHTEAEALLRLGRVRTGAPGSPRRSRRSCWPPACSLPC